MKSRRTQMSARRRFLLSELARGRVSFELGGANGGYTLDMLVAELFQLEAERLVYSMRTQPAERGMGSAYMRVWALLTHAGDTAIRHATALSEYGSKTNRGQSAPAESAAGSEAAAGQQAAEPGDEIRAAGA